MRGWWIRSGEGKKGIRNDAHESHPEIRIEDVFSALFSEKGISADESLVRQAGQFFRILSIEHIRLFSQNLSISIIFCLREPLWSETTGYAILKGRKEPDLSKILMGEPMRKKAGKHDGRNGGEN